MTHLPYIAASYGITLTALSALSLALIWRLRRARRVLTLLEARSASELRP
ncbi:heme exporter protein CcmD [Asaia sp. VD9]